MPSDDSENPRTVSRRLLLTTGLGFSMGLAGCAGANPSNTPSATTTSQPRQMNLECPPYTVKTEITVCGFSASSGDPAILEPNRDEIPQNQQDTLEFTLTNHTNRTIEFNPYSWNIRTKSSSDWERHRPNASGDGSKQITSEASASWTLAEIKEAIALSTTLSPGMHAVDIRVPNVADNEADVTCIAVVRVNRADSNNGNEDMEPAIRGKADEVRTKQKVTDSEVEYLQETNEVRYVAGYEGDSPKKSEQSPIYSTVPFSEWADSKAASFGSLKINQVIRSRYEKSSGVEVGKTHYAGAQVVSVIQRNDPSGGEDTNQDSIRDLTSITPKSVVVTVNLDNQSYRNGYEVWVTISSPTTV